VAKRGPAGRVGDEPRADSDRLAAAADELYDADPAGFTDRRKALADAARAAGDGPAAKRITALRKPTRAAWVVNRLSRADVGAPDRLAELADSLRAAEEAKDGPRLRELSAIRGQLVDALTAQALAAAGVHDPPAGLREEVSATLTAAIADPEVADEFASGTLTRAAQWAGFGLASFGESPFGSAPDDAAPPTDEGAPARRHLRAVPSPEVSGPARTRAGSRRSAPAQVPEEEQARRTRAEEQRLAEEAAQRTAQRRAAFEDAERTVASTAAAAAEAGAAEDQLEAEVRDLEQRLTQTREDLAAARMRARRAESAERRARQTLDRLPRPE